MLAKASWNPSGWPGLRRVAACASALVMGAKGKVTGYQIMAHNVPKEDESLWQLPSWGTLKFVETLRSRVSRRPGFP